MTQTQHDPVNHPKHYNCHPSGVECITVTEHMGFNLGNAVKYIWRADEKGSAIEDLKKAAWYLQREIEKRVRKDEKFRDLFASVIQQESTTFSEAKRAPISKEIEESAVFQDSRTGFVPMVIHELGNQEARSLYSAGHPNRTSDEK